MISWILAGILAIWCLINRFSVDGKVEGEPLGMPRGTVRAYITLIIIAFPFHYIFFGGSVPELIINAIFVLVAFYFEARKSGIERLKKIVEEIRDPEKFQEEEKKEKKPLYLPKYSVRISMVLLLTAILLIEPDVPFEITNKVFDLIIIVGLFLVGGIIRGIVNYRKKQVIKGRIDLIENFQSLSVYEIVDKIIAEEKSWWAKKGKSIISYIMLIIVFTALILFTIEFQYNILDLPAFNYTLSLKGILLLLVNAYYGFRD
ncbi:MAG: hypothetical protein ACFE8L_07910 [Candidatus Hodarchaeota archaeon]